ncbi:MAG: acyl-CoA thioesterase [Proteobacteria bacterium]|nr:acyl-CoA thioesterase [Pseudomonadota bacterium]
MAETLEGRSVDHSRMTLSQVILPSHTGPGGVWAHGGEVMKLMDTAAGLAALRHSHSPVVTLRVEGINFLKPIRVGNLIVVQAELTYVSQSTMEVRVTVTAEDILNERSFEAITAYFLFVAIGEDGRSRPVPPLILRTSDEEQRYVEGRTRHEECRVDEHGRMMCALT